MPITNEDIFQEVRRYRPKDWTVTFLWISLFLSATMITGTLMWNLGKTMRVESYLQEHSVNTCLALHLPPAQMSKPQDSTPSTKQLCEHIVSQSHQRCFDRTEHLKNDLRTRRTDYMACVMELGSQQAAVSTTD